MAKTGGFANSPKQYGQFEMVLLWNEKKIQWFRILYVGLEAKQASLREVNFLIKLDVPVTFVQLNKALAVSLYSPKQIGKTKKQIL